MEKKASDKARQTVFFTPLNLFGENPDVEEPHDDYTVPQKDHYHSHWKRNQDAVCWIKLSRAQDLGLRFWQTKSFAIITHNSVPGDSIFRIVSQKGDRVMFERLSTPRPAPKVTLKSHWHVQQQQPIRDEFVNSTSKDCKMGGQSGTRDRTRDTTGVEIASRNSWQMISENRKLLKTQSCKMKKKCKKSNSS